jgi:hypothetical protein
MSRLSLLLAVALLGACGGPPLLQNVPRPNTAAVAGVAAGTAAALTLANPQGAAAAQEARKPNKELQAKRSEADVPSDVLDRLDEKQKQKPAEADTAAAAEGAAPTTIAVPPNAKASDFESPSSEP